MKATLAVLALWLPFAAAANVVLVGDTPIEIPSPVGFTAVSRDMPTVYEIHRQFTPATNLLLTSFIPESVAAPARAGEFPPMNNVFSVQTLQADVARTVSRQEFAEVRNLLTQQNEQFVSQVNDLLSEHLESAADTVGEQFDVEFALSLNDLVALPVHEQSDQSIAYSGYMHMQSVDDQGETLVETMTFTQTTIHVKSKLLFLYAHGSEDDLDWTREVSTSWAEAIFAANAATVSDIGTAADAEAAIYGAIEQKVFERRLVRGVIGLIAFMIIAFIMVLIVRRKENKPE